MRPLSEVSKDPNDPPPLRPSDFLHSEVLGITPDWRSHTLYRKVKDELQQLQQEMWTRMRKEVLSGIQKLKVWHTKNTLDEGDLVLYANDEWRPDCWPLGRVLEVFPGKDGEGRVVRIRYCSQENPGQTKEGIHSTKNVYKVAVPEAATTRRLTRAWQKSTPEGEPEGDVPAVPEPLRLQ